MKTVRYIVFDYTDPAVKKDIIVNNSNIEILDHLYFSAVL